MSKTSSRQARKRKLEAQRKVLASRSVVGWEEHHRVVVELERVSAVLADLIEEQKGAAVPARQVVNWVKNPELVRAVFDGSDDFYDCPHCDVQRGGAHYRTCVLAMAWRETGHRYAEQDLARAHGESLQENNRRTVGLKQPLFPNRRAVRITGLFDRQPNTNQLRGYRDRQLMLNPRDLPRVEPTLREDGIGQFDGIEVVTSDLVRPGEAYLMNPADFAMPPVSSPHRPSLFIPPATYELWRGNVVPPRTIEGRMEQAQQLVELGRVMPAEYVRFLTEAAPVETRDPEWRREYLGEFPAAPQVDECATCGWPVRTTGPRCSGH